ncbi:hypothetical protein WDW37_18510 [Bdellovibrionota bacterium FG-1]
MHGSAPTGLSEISNSMDCMSNQPHYKKSNSSFDRFIDNLVAADMKKGSRKVLVGTILFLIFILSLLILFLQHPVKIEIKGLGSWLAGAIPERILMATVKKEHYALLNEYSKYDHKLEWIQVKIGNQMHVARLETQTDTDSQRLAITIKFSPTEKWGDEDKKEQSSFSLYISIGTYWQLLLHSRKAVN